MTVPGQEQSAKTRCIQGHNTHKIGIETAKDAKDAQEEA